MPYASGTAMIVLIVRLKMHFREQEPASWAQSKLYSLNNIQEDMKEERDKKEREHFKSKRI